MPSALTMVLGVCTALAALVMYGEFRKRYPADNNEPGVIRDASINIAAWLQNTHPISTAVYRTAFVLIWGGTCYLIWLWVASFWLIEPGHTIQPVRGVGNDLATVLVCFGIPLGIAWIVWRCFTRLFVHSSHKELRKRIGELERRQRIAGNVLNLHGFYQEYSRRVGDPEDSGDPQSVDHLL